MPRGGRKGNGGRGRGKGKSDHLTASDDAASSDGQTKTAVASSDKTKMSSQNKTKIKSA